MYQNILVPVDGSTTSNHAIQEAARLARHQEQSTHLKLVHVVADIHLMDANSYINYAEMKEVETSIGKKILAQAQTLARQAGMTAEVKLLEAGGERIASILVAEATTLAGRLDRYRDPRPLRFQPGSVRQCRRRGDTYRTYTRVTDSRDVVKDSDKRKYHNLIMKPCRPIYFDGLHNMNHREDSHEIPTANHDTRCSPF